MVPMVPNTWDFLWGNRGKTELHEIQINANLKIGEAGRFFAYERPTFSIAFMPTVGEQINCGYDAGISNYKRP